MNGYLQIARDGSRVYFYDLAGSGLLILDRNNEKESSARESDSKNASTIE